LIPTTSVGIHVNGCRATLLALVTLNMLGDECWEALLYDGNPFPQCVPKPSSLCFQRFHQGEKCPSSYACSNSTHNTNNIVIETEGSTGMGLIAGREILPDEIIAVFGDAIILQEMRLVQEFTNFIDVYNLCHPTRWFQY